MIRRSREERSRPLFLRTQWHTPKGNKPTSDVPIGNNPDAGSGSMSSGLVGVGVIASSHSHPHPLLVKYRRESL